MGPEEERRDSKRWVSLLSSSEDARWVRLAFGILHKQLIQVLHYEKMDFLFGDRLVICNRNFDTFARPGYKVRASRDGFLEN